MSKEGFHFAINNARKQYEAAECIGQTKNYGLAVALLILASEEAVKAFSILAKGLNIQSSFSEYEKVFSSHSTKIEQIRGIILVSEISKKMSDLIYLPIYSLDNKSSSEIPKTKKKGIKDFISWLSIGSKEKRSKLHKQMKWWKDAQNLKENGLYVRPELDGWHSPINIKKKTYDTAHSYITEILTSIELIGEIDYTKEPYSDLLALIKDKLTTEQV